MYVMSIYIYCSNPLESILLLNDNVTTCLLIGVFYKGIHICVKFDTIINCQTYELEKITIKLLLWIQIVYADIFCIYLHIWIKLINYIS